MGALRGARVRRALARCALEGGKMRTNEEKIDELIENQVKRINERARLLSEKALLIEYIATLRAAYAFHPLKEGHARGIALRDADMIWREKLPKSIRESISQGIDAVVASLRIKAENEE
jgi:hypothetical protein